MRILLLLVIGIFLSAPVAAEDFQWDNSVWVQRHARTVIGTGTADDKLVIQTAGDSCWLSFTFGSIKRVHDRRSTSQIFKEETTTHSHIQVVLKGVQISFVLPESNAEFRLRRVVRDDGIALEGTRELTKDELMGQSFGSNVAEKHARAVFWLRKSGDSGHGPMGMMDE